MLRHRRVFGQMKIAREDDLEPRQDHGAELAPAIDHPTLRVLENAIHVQIGSKYPVMAATQSGDHLGLINFCGSLPEPFDLLQSNNVRFADFLYYVLNAATPVSSENVLKIISDRFHGRCAPQWANSASDEDG